MLDQCGAMFDLFFPDTASSYLRRPSGAQRTEGGCAARLEQDECGPPKAIIARSFFAAKIERTPF